MTAGPLRWFVAALAAVASAGCRPGDGASTTTSTTAPTSTTTTTATTSTTTTAIASGGGVDTTSGASTHYQDGASVVASGSVDGALLRKRHKDRISADASPVTLLRGKTALELGQRICEASVPKRPAETPILLKPNLCGFDSMQDAASHEGDDGVRGRTTDPEFVRGVIRCLKARGHTKITIAEGCGFPRDGFEKLVTLSGYGAMSKSEGVAMVAMDDDGTYDVVGEQPGKPLAIRGIEDTPVATLLLPKILAEHLDHGLFISLPKLKVHRFSVVSLGIKGMQGTVMLSDKSPAYQQKWRMHKELNDYLKTGKNEHPDDRAQYVDALTVFGERMAAVLEISAPDVVLVEGAPAEGGDGFQKLVPYAEQVAIGGTNPIAVDKVGSEFLGLWNNEKLGLGLRGHMSSPLIEAAAKRFGFDLDRVTVTGDGADILKSPRPVHFKALAPFGVEINPPRVH